MDVKDIRCTHAEGAGCYGHNGADDVALDAALLARATGGRPVKLQWMRDDEFMWEPYGSAMVMKLGAALDAQGNVVSWSHEVWSHPHSTRPGSSKGSHTLAARHLARPVGAEPVRDVPLPSGGADRNAVPGYDFPAVKVSKHFILESPLRTSALRTLGGYANVFAAESFMDELARAAGVDPVEFRLRHMKDPRSRWVIEATAARAGWKPGARGWGFAYSKYKNLGCYCAIAAEVAVDRKTGQVRVLRAVSAVDVGQAVNPDGVVNQIEGGFIQSASWTLKEAVSFDRTRVKTRSWADYPILRFDEVPQVDVAVDVTGMRAGVYTGLIRVSAPVEIIEPLRRVEHRRVIFPDSKEQLPVLAGHVKIHVAVAAGKNSRRRDRTVLAAGALRYLLLVGPKTNDMLLGRQGLLHRCINVIAFSRALAPVKGCEHARRREQAREVVRLSFRRPHGR